MNIGKAIRENRTYNEMSYAELSKRSGYGVDTLYRLEHKGDINTTIYTVEAIAGVFGKKASDLLREAELYG